MQCAAAVVVAIALGAIGGHAQKYVAQEIPQTLMKDFDMNVDITLRKLGLRQNTSGFANVTRKCFGPLGCLEVSEEWYGLTRPLNALPQDREVVNTHFLLSTRNTFVTPEYLNSSDLSTLYSSAFNGSLPTKIIVHGFLDSSQVPWVTEMTEALLKFGDFNVIAVDWGGGAWGGGFYNQAAANTRLVGLEIAYLIEKLVLVYSAQLSDFHIIGHSLGCHIAGYAGERLIEMKVGKLGRISALDPADPLFRNTPDFVRLDPSDADFVDVIHTDAKLFGYGLEEAVGHVDFYPNGGMNQPGCSLLDLPVTINAKLDPDPQRTKDSVSRHLVACSHTRAFELYIESLKVDQGCLLVGHECRSFDEFREGKCFHCGVNNEHCAMMGYRSIDYAPGIKRSERERIKFFLATGKGGREPFCNFQYLLDIGLAKPTEAETWVQGYLKVSLHGTKAEIKDVDLTDKFRGLLLTHGASARFLVQSPVHVGQLRFAQLSWNCGQSYFWMWRSCQSTLFVNSINVVQDVAPDQLNVPRDRNVVVCPDSRTEFADIKSGESKLFYKPC